VRRLLTLACLLVGGGIAAADGGARVRWRGVTVEGKAPAQLSSAAAAHVAVALRQLGSKVTQRAPAEVEAQARCGFGASRLAKCVVEVTAAAGRSQRRAEIPYRDAEDLAESLALLVSDVLIADFPNVVGRAPPRPPRAKAAAGSAPAGRSNGAAADADAVTGRGSALPGTAVTGGPDAAANAPQGGHRAPANAPGGRAPEITPAPLPPPLAAVPPLPPVAPPTVPPREDEAAAQARLRAERAHQEALASRAERAERSAGAGAAATTRTGAPDPPRARVTVAGGVAGIFGLGSNNPSLVAGTAGVGYARGLLRLSTTLSLAGMRETRERQPLGFFRALVGARAGLGITTGIVDFDATAGPALAVLSTDARGVDSHVLASFAVVVGPRLALTVWGPLALVLGADLDIVVTEEKITAGPVTVAQFSRFGLEAGIALAWRSGWKASAATPLTP
jgi:hypothetical protein